ncbi:MAG: hypothetical protein ACJ73D_00870 [Pyrinomonadaceae bacterium]
MYKRFIPITLMLLLACGLTLADVAPPDGYVNVSRDIVLHTDDDLSEYRFFIVSGNLFREVTPQKGQTVSVSSLGGGARYSSGVLYAVPRKNVSEFPAQLSREQSEKLTAGLIQNKFPGAVQLLRHGFNSEVRKEDAANVSDAEYRIAKTAAGIKADQLPSRAASATPKKASQDAVTTEPRFSPVADGLILAAIAIGVGLMFARSRHQKSS